MAEKKTNATATKDKKTTTVNKIETKEEKKGLVEDELNLDVKVTVKNLAGWDVTFARLHDGFGDIIITSGGKQRLSRNEIQAQINNGNKLFTGTDGQGSHATIYIEDAPTRKWVGFEDDGKEQIIFSDNTVKYLFSLKDDDFTEKVPKYIATRAEKYAFIEAIKRLGLNDYRKIHFATNYTGYKLNLD